MNPQPVEVIDTLNPVDAVAERHLYNFSDAHRQMITNRMARLIDLDDQSISIDTGDELVDTPEKDDPAGSERVHKLLSLIGRELEYNHSGQDSEDAVWANSIRSLLGRVNYGTIQNPPVKLAHEAALTMARLSGQEKLYLELIDIAAFNTVNASTAGLAVLTPSAESYVPVSLPAKEAISQFIDLDRADDVISYISGFAATPNEVAHIFIDKNKQDAVVDALYAFNSLDTSVAEKLIDGGHLSTVIGYMYVFEGADTAAIAKAAVAQEQEILVASNLFRFRGLDSDIANALIKKGHIEDVMTYTYAFDKLSPQVMDMFIETGHMETVAWNIERFEDVSPETYLSLIHNGFANSLIENVGWFKHKTAVLDEMKKEILLDPVLYPTVIYVMDHYGFDVAQKEAIFSELCTSNYNMAQTMQELNLASYGFSEEFITEIRERAAAVEPPVEGLSEGNPYSETMGSLENVTITVPGTKEHLAAVDVNRRLRGALEDESHLLHFIAMTIDAKYAELTQQLYDRLGPEKSQLISGNGITTNNLAPLYRRLTADFIALQLKDRTGGVEGVNAAGLDVLDEELIFALERANAHFLEIFERDVPYYDKLFSEWDIKRLGQKEFQEVFLGRDGVYAYVGRRAQMYARQHVLGLDGGTQMPTYLVYPRLFMGFNEDLKKTYLNQSIKNPKAAHYFDTGFVGTIPQDIMKVLGMSEDQWDQRIRLLSAHDKNRTILRIKGERGDSESESDVHAIEGNDKDEETALGLYYDKTGDNRELKHYAQPFSNAERLSFALIQQALHRHYYVQEIEKLNSQQERIAMKQHQLDGVELRVRTQLSEQQTSEVVALFDGGNIGQKLLKQSTHIQLSDPNDPYPNEAVFELPLSGMAQGMIIKSTNPAQQQGPLDEFEALLLLEELGIDAPKPIARIFTNEQQGFIAMEKLPGVSGRTFIQTPAIAKLNPKNKQRILKQALDQMRVIAEKVRRDTGFDKPWTIDDFMIVTGKDTRRRTVIERMLPINFERARVYDPSAPEITYLGQDLDELLYTVPLSVPSVKKVPAFYGGDYFMNNEDGEEMEEEEEDEET